jgi:hypothetical protein
VLALHPLPAGPSIALRDGDAAGGRPEQPSARLYDHTVISPDLARRLKEAGLAWSPRDGDRFYIPDRDLDDRTFAISEMVVTVRIVPDGRQIAFNGAVEWALDAIMQREVVWLPTEPQLRALLGSSFLGLRRSDEGYRCEAHLGGRVHGFVAAGAADAYGLAVLAALLGGQSGS